MSQKAKFVIKDLSFYYGEQFVEHGRGEQIFTKPRNKRTEDYITSRFG
jgi:ABC-type phosphate transport system ATPase subunit